MQRVSFSGPFEPERVDLAMPILRTPVQLAITNRFAQMLDFYVL